MSLGSILPGVGYVRWSNEAKKDGKNFWFRIQGMLWASYALGTVLAVGTGLNWYAERVRVLQTMNPFEQHRLMQRYDENWEKVFGKNGCANIDDDKDHVSIAEYNLATVMGGMNNGIYMSDKGSFPIHPKDLELVVANCEKKNIPKVKSPPSNYPTDAMLIRPY